MKSTRERALQAVDARIDAIIADCDPIVVNYITEISCKRGKLIRPRLMNALASMFGQAEPEIVANCAACCELLHTATLIHDDVIDEAQTRRGNLTLNNRYGNEIAVVVGDYLLALVLKAVNSERNFRLVDMVLETSQEMGLGVIEEIHHRNNFRMDVGKYYEVIYLKTAALFKLCCAMGAYLGGADEETVQAAGEYGKQLGLGFQVFDDLLDFLVEESKTGKPKFNDLREGRITLPMIHALQELPAETRELIENFQVSPNEQMGQAIREHLSSQGSFGFAHTEAMGFISAAREQVPRFNGAVSEEVLAELTEIESQITRAVPVGALEQAS